MWPMQSAARVCAWNRLTLFALDFLFSCQVCSEEDTSARDRILQQQKLLIRRETCYIKEVRYIYVDVREYTIEPL